MIVSRPRHFFKTPVWPEGSFDVEFVGSLVRLVLLHCFSAFRDSMLCEFSWKDEFARRLDVASRHGLFLAVLAETSSFRSNLLEGVVHKGIQDGHSFLGDSNLRVDLLQDFVDVDVEGFISFASTWLVAGAACWSSSWHDSSLFL